MTIFSHRILHVFGGIALVLLTSPTLLAQGIPDDRNINIVGINSPTATGAIPDTGLRQQNESACAMKPSNPLQILCAFNDYRGVDDPMIGDTWEGYSFTINGGQTWFSDLLPGHRGDAESLDLDFAADPQVAAAPGLALISYIAADRGDGAEGGLFLQRMFEVNREAGTPWLPASMPLEVVRGNADAFIDKPFMLLHPATLGGDTVAVSGTLRDGTTAIQQVPAATIYLAYTTFSGTVEDSDLFSKIELAKSDDFGETWSNTVIANSSCQMPGQGHCKDKGKGHRKGKGKGHSKRKDVIQSASLAANGDNVCAVWRRFEDLDEPDAIMVSCSADRGESFAMPAVLSATPDFLPFDQGTTEATFRTNSYPVITNDGESFYAFWTSRIATSTPFFGRVVYSVSENGSDWSAPVMLEDVLNGHQFMPSVAAASGTLQIAWYDTRSNLFQADFIQDRPGVGAIPDEDADKIIRNRADIRTAQIINGSVTPSVQVSRYAEGALTVDGPVQQLEFNFLNDRIFKQGTVPFVGDYPNVAAPSFRVENGNWVSNVTANPTQKPVDFLVTWSDNRNVGGNVWEDLSIPTTYTPGDMATTAAVPTDAGIAIETPNENTFRADIEPDETQAYGVCVPGTNADRSRNQNVYSSVVRPGVSLDSPSSSKPTGTVQRAHVVWVSNNEATASSYTLTIENQPPDAGTNGRASFLQVPVAPFADNTGLLTEITIDLDANSTVARTVYVTSQTPEPEIAVSVSDGGTVVFGTITLNGDILSPDVQNPDVQNPDVQNPDIQNAEVHNPDVQNPVIVSVQNPDVQNPDVQNPDVQNPDVQNPDVQNPDVQNPDIQNPDVQNTSLEGSSSDNPDVANDTLTPAEKEEGYTDITYEVTNDGNTTTSFNLDAFVNGETAGLDTQLIATRTHVTETSADCVPGKLLQNQVIFNAINPDLSLLDGDSDDGVFGDGSAYIAPGETIFVTLRVWGDPLLFDPTTAGVKAVSQSCNSDDKTAGTLDCDPPAVQTVPPTADITFDLIPAGGADIFAADINTGLQQFGVVWTEQGGVLRVTNGTGGPFANIAAPSLAFNTFTGLPDGTHTATFVCPDGSGRAATVDAASIQVADTEAVPNPRAQGRSFNIFGELLETVNLTGVSETLAFSAGPISRIQFTDSGGDGHLLDNLNLSGFQCVDGATTFTQTVITGDASILNAGSLVRASNMNVNTAVSVGNIIFDTNQTGFTSPAGAWLFSGGDFSTDPVNTTWSTSLDAVLSSNQFLPFGQTNGELEITGLTPGVNYRLQLLFSNDLNTTANDIEVTVEGVTWVLNSWQPDAINLIVDFNASAASVVVEFNAGPNSTSESGRAHVNGFVIHGPSIIP